MNTTQIASKSTVHSSSRRARAFGRLAPSPQYSRYAALPADRDGQRLHAELAALPVEASTRESRRSLWAALRGSARLGQAHGPGGRSAPRAA